VLWHVLTGRLWLAADPVLGPAPGGAELQIVQTGAWLLPDPSPLPAPLERFLADGEPPVYIGFGSMRAVERGSQMLVEAARALGLRSILSQGWGNLLPIDAGTDCLSIGDVSHERLFPRVAAVVHHGGARTTTAAARAGKPQVIVPYGHDQDYWAYRVQQLGVGTSGPTIESLTADGLISALRECLDPEVAARAQQLAPRIQLDGARLAARRIDGELA
jgi:vancomycin aglycone glucosyltransferase